MSSPLNVKNLLDFTEKLSRFKHGSTASAILNQQKLLGEAKTVLEWFKLLPPERQQQMLGVLVEPAGKLFKKNGQRLLVGPTTTIPQPNATPVQAGVIRKTFLAVGRMLRAAEASVAEWLSEKEEEVDDELSSDEGERDSPPKRKRPSRDERRSEPPKKQKPMSHALSRRRVRAMVRVRAAYRATLSLAKALEEVPHAFGDEMEWSICPEACPEISERAVAEGDFATVEDLEEATDVPPSVLDAYIAFRRGSAVIWHAHLRKCPSVVIDSLVDPRKQDWLSDMPKQAKGLFTDDVAAGEPTRTPNNDTLTKKADVAAAADKLFNGDLYAADGVRRATGALTSLNVSAGPLEGMNLALPTPVEAEDYRELFQRLATGFILSWNPDYLLATWTRFIQSRRDAGQATTRSAKAKPTDVTTPSPRTPKAALHCFQWNARKCSKKNCKFPHVCSICGGNHRKKDCKQSAQDAQCCDDEEVEPGRLATTRAGDTFEDDETCGDTLDEEDPGGAPRPGAWTLKAPKGDADWKVSAAHPGGAPGPGSQTPKAPKSGSSRKKAPREPGRPFSSPDPPSGNDDSAPPGESSSNAPLSEGRTALQELREAFLKKSQVREAAAEALVERLSSCGRVSMSPPNAGLRSCPP
ncbi:hypothetical protein CYMTET_48590 [Cymbomonas tetramitiformis]|uniref:Uncharacterized protein n=1 Tax=Cymbomonas tetramitiformis TaxID=36881 RepID=A0AAE0BTL0_9CHLO|nr:hypothetical protein CYMTET_48590 [Cymbomonas tetramitiformis]